MTSFTFPIKAAELLAERCPQFHGWGIPEATLAAVRGQVRDVWADGPGGWTFEWSAEAERAAREGRLLEAALLFGAARFPCACTPARQVAAQRQLDCYERAMRVTSLHFQRRVLQVPYRGGQTNVPLHVFSQPTSSVPWILLSGGVDTFKVELHRVALLLHRLSGCQVAVMDMPGTGESEVPLSPDADEIYRGVVQKLRGAAADRPRIGLLGFSFGAHWAAKLALQRTVDAAVDCGGPIGESAPGDAALRDLPNGMTGIVAYAMRLGRIPDGAELTQIFTQYSLRAQGLLPGGDARACPLLVVNGDHDVYIAPENSTVFRGLPQAEVWLIERAGHCAAEHMGRFLPAVATWFRLQLRGASVLNRLGYAAARALLPQHS